MRDASEYAKWIVTNRDKKGTPEFETVARAYQAAKTMMREPQQDEVYDPTGSFTENALAGAGKAFVDLYRGGKQALGIGDQNALQAEIDESRRLDAPLMETGGGLTGNIAGTVAATAPTMAIPGANTVTGAGVLGSLLGGAQPTSEGESRIKNTLMGGVAGAAGQYATGLLGKGFTGKATNEAQRMTRNVQRDAVVKEAMDAGYVLPPVTVNPQSNAAKVAEGISGKILTHQTAALKNQNITNSLARNAVGLADDAPLSDEALSTIRKAAGNVYQRVGSAVESFDVDGKFTKAIDDAFTDYNALKAEFPEMTNKSLDELSEMLQRKTFSGQNMTRLIRKIRKDAKTNWKAFDNPEKLDLARAQSKAVAALEDLVERNLDEAQPGLMFEFKNARATIAKAHAIESALDEAGNVDAHKIAKMLDKGEPLSGPLRIIGKTAQNFRDATRKRTDSVNQLSLPTVAGAAFGAGMGEPGLTALALSRPIVRAGMFTKPGQSLLSTPRYGAPVSGLLGQGLQSEYGGLLGRSLPPALIGSLQ